MKKISEYLNLEALNIVISNPDALVVGIWHLLWGIPSLGRSLLQESADLTATRANVKDRHIIHVVLSYTCVDRNSLLAMPETDFTCTESEKDLPHSRPRSQTDGCKFQQVLVHWQELPQQC